MKRITRMLSMLLALVTALSLFGCSVVPTNTAEPTATAAAETAQPVETAAPEPTVDPATEAAEAALKELDMKIFCTDVVSDALSFHLSLAHPENFSLITDYPTGWGDFSYAAQEESNAENEEWFEELCAIDRDALTEDSKITYDTLYQTLEPDGTGMDYYYYGEVLDTLVGLHSNLPLNLVFYDMDCKEDVENYLTLLADTPRYVGQILAFEQEKSAAGKFMRDSALDTVLGQIQDFIDSRETCFLLGTFDEFIADIDELTDEERAAYSARNEELVNALIDSYQVLYDGLEALRGTATNEAGLCGYGDEGKAYFEAELKYSASSDITPEEALSVLNSELDTMINKLYNAMSKDETVSERYNKVNLSVGTTEENMEYLEKLMADYYPALPEHTVTFMDCPSELEDQFSPAAYLIPPVDDASQNLIILNAKTLEDETRYLDTLAHEGYPGHMYQYQYLRTLIDKTGYTRQNLSLTGYYESWSQSAEIFFDNYNTRFGSAYCNYMNANASISGLLLPAIASIQVNYYGATVDDIYELTSSYYSEDAAKELADIYYQYAVENPFYFIEYAVGFSIYQQKLAEAKKLCDIKFDLMSFNETYLNIGPTYFNISMPIMDEWISEHKK